MKFMELKSSHYNKTTKKTEAFGRFMKDMENSGWEIHDRGDAPACWVNHQMGMNHDVFETYEDLKAKFTRAGLMLDLENIGTVPENDLQVKLDQAVQALKFYANKDNWFCTVSAGVRMFKMITEADREFVDDGHFGGKFARYILTKLGIKL